MKILITGGAGFIGSAVVRHIIRDTDDSVVNVDKLTYAGNLESLTEVHADPRYAFEKVDIVNRAALDSVFREHRPDAVILNPAVTPAHLHDQPANGGGSVARWLPACA